MLFNSWFFLIVFMPMCLAVYYAAIRTQRLQSALRWLALCSLVFYGWWDYRYLVLLGVSILFNYFIGNQLVRCREGDELPRRKHLLLIGILCNLLALGYYKYTVFFVTTIESFYGLGLKIPEIILPIGISFFTFTQIAYLVDAYQGKAEEYSLLNYVLFVTFFPHLIAGPILHYREMMPQFENPKIMVVDWQNIGVGTVVFILGLFKKVCIADNLSEAAVAVFGAAATGSRLGGWEAWIGALSYTFQIYFDFSGYSEMAIGLALLFNIRLPVNFFSPYRAVSIVDFWRRWHMTLSRYLRDYLYVPLGGNRHGLSRRYINLMVTMLLGGFWHGANWTFIVWGLLHGFYLVVNHAWQYFCQVASISFFGRGRIGKIASQGITFLAVVVAWVFFRSDDIATALRVLQSMGNVHTAGSVSAASLFPVTHLSVGKTLGFLTIAASLAFFVPNVLEITGKYKPALNIPQQYSCPSWYAFFAWKPSLVWACCLAIMAASSLLFLGRASEFLYFQF
jgi:D-alanyl-lipoteichoic acid acyltransferase DltB (MBOAT superfamily)